MSDFSIPDNARDVGKTVIQAAREGAIRVLLRRLRDALRRPRCDKELTKHLLRDVDDHFQHYMRNTDNEVRYEPFTPEHMHAADYTAYIMDIIRKRLMANQLLHAVTVARPDHPNDILTHIQNVPAIRAGSEHLYPKPMKNHGAAIADAALKMFFENPSIPEDVKQRARELLAFAEGRSDVDKV